ncbi:MAG: Crp/Fnr family transcriptional regulator [Candidatus Adiutrix sp.]|nr:Crp/Fnr family transcriptional regulator [Candidatus Adiutrix sp.]
MSALLACLSAVQRGFEKGEPVFSAGDDAAPVGVVLAGGVNVMQEDYWGNRMILAHIEPGGLFGEAFSCAGAGELPVSASAVEKSEILLIDCGKIVATCSSACAFHAGMIRNMLQILARKNIALVEKIGHLSRRTTREKLLSYLSSRAKAAGSPAFDIPFNRQELADYLAVDRSAMSAELSKMRDENLLRYSRSHFELMGEETRP